MRSAILNLATLSLALGVSGCGNVTIEPDNNTRGLLTRGKGKADGTNSCKGHCGGMAPSSCWCDPGCVQFGDCCPDKVSVCDGKQPTCKGFCGKQSADGCFCDDSCTAMGDCCPDKTQVCSDKTVACAKNEECKAGQYCHFKIGEACESDVSQPKGVCTVKPEACIEIYGPVCGCDGKTYGNDCYAAAAGVAVLRTGECDLAPVGKCTDNSGCKAGEYCHFKDGDCALSSIQPVGVCMVKPEACYEIYGPVCGCDGKTYGNDCYAAAAGVSIHKIGECNPSSGKCYTNSNCLSNQYCMTEPGKCVPQATVIIEGKCVDRPEACYDLYAPVCGCNLKVYSNGCDAAEMGVSIYKEGDC